MKAGWLIKIRGRQEQERIRLQASRPETQPFSFGSSGRKAQRADAPDPRPATNPLDAELRSSP